MPTQIDPKSFSWKRLIKIAIATILLSIGIPMLLLSAFFIIFTAYGIATCGGGLECGGNYLYFPLVIVFFIVFGVVTFIGYSLIRHHRN